MIYVYRCEECGQDLEREFPMGEAPDKIVSSCVNNDDIEVECRRVFLPLRHQWRASLPGVRDRVDEARAIREDPNKEVSITYT